MSTKTPNNEKSISTNIITVAEKGKELKVHKAIRIGIPKIEELLNDLNSIKIKAVGILKNQPKKFPKKIKYTGKLMEKIKSFWERVDRSNRVKIGELVAPKKVKENREAKKKRKVRGEEK